MKTRSLFPAALLAFGVTLGFTGCAQQPIIGGSHLRSSQAPRTFALAVTLPDGGQLTPVQWAGVKAAFEQQLAAAGCTLTDNISLADQIIRVVFTPAEDDPTNGNAMVLSVRANSAYAFNTGTSLMPASYSSSFGGSYGYGSGLSNYSYYGYNDYYSGGSTVTPRIDPPSHNHPSRPIDCPPGQDHPTHSPGSSDHYAGGNQNGSWNGGSGSGRWNSGSSDGSQRSWSGNSGSSDHSSHNWGSSGSSGSSSPSYSSSSYSTGPAPVSGASYSAPSISFSGSSSSSSSSPSFSSSSSSDSSSSSSAASSGSTSGTGSSNGNQAER
jgi:hypothetical protein